MAIQEAAVQVDGTWTDDDDTGDSEREDKHLLFILGDEQYGIPIDRVQSIEELQKIVVIPDVPRHVRGVINLRGTVIPVVELRRRFGMPEREFDDRTCIVVCKARTRVVGFIVDTVSEVHSLPPDSIQPPPEFDNDASVASRCITGLGMLNGDVKVLLDVDALVASDDLPDEKSLADQSETTTDNKPE